MSLKATDFRNEVYWIVHIGLSAFLLLVLYGILNTSYLLEQVLSFFLMRGNVFRISDVSFLEKMIKVIFLYGRDFLWGYSLVFSCCALFHRNRSEIKTAFKIAGIFEILMVIFRFTIIPTFSMNLYCLLAMSIGDGVALILIMAHERYLL